MNKRFNYILTAALMLSTFSCTEEYLNPSAASEQQVVSDVNGLLALCNGLHFTYTVGGASPGYTVPTAVGLTTQELTVLNAGNTNEDNLRLGRANVQGNNSIVSNLWQQSNIVKANADLILKNVDAVKADAGTKAGITAYASIFKALALGNLGTFWEKAPIKVGESAAFSTRQEVLQEAIKQLEAGAAAITASPVSSTFTSKIISGIDIANTLQALIARYSLMLGDNDKALAAANKVDITKRSVFVFDDLNRNPLFNFTFSNRNVTEPTGVNFGLPASLAVNPADKRINFFYNRTAGQNLARASFFTANDAAVPVYRPGEILLIKAEAQARKSNLTEAIAELNKVLTKTTDAVGIGAALPAYSGATTQEAVLTEIYRQRVIELFFSGLRLDDARRFGRPDSELGRRFFPYPLSERDNNKGNVPDDPTF